MYGVPPVLNLLKWSGEVRAPCVKKREARVGGLEGEEDTEGPAHGHSGGSGSGSDPAVRSKAGKVRKTRAEQIVDDDYDDGERARLGAPRQNGPWPDLQ